MKHQFLEIEPALHALIFVNRHGCLLQFSCFKTNDGQEFMQQLPASKKRLATGPTEKAGRVGKREAIFLHSEHPLPIEGVAPIEAGTTTSHGFTFS
jgi:hypothetical protein